MAATPWIVDRRFDLGWFFGGAALSVLVLALHFGAGVSVVILWWTWIALFDGPHMAAAFSRTYADREEWRRRPGVLVSSLLVILIGPLCLALGAATRSPAPFFLFLGVATLYSAYHLVRQHYGFLALYRARSGERDGARLERWALYAGCWAPYGYFLLTHPKARALLGLPPDVVSGFERAGSFVLAALYASALGVFVVRARRGSVPKSAYVLLTLLLYGLIYFVIGRLEPVYGRSRGPDEDFLLLSVLLGIRHNVEYVGLVWFHNRNRYSGADGRFGAAGRLSASLPRYLAACVAFSLTLYVAIAAATGVFPALSLGLDGTLTRLALAIWWGIALNHYVLDQKIWRIRNDADLARNLGLAPAGA